MSGRVTAGLSSLFGSVLVVLAVRPDLLPQRHVWHGVYMTTNLAGHEGGRNNAQRDQLQPGRAGSGKGGGLGARHGAPGGNEEVGRRSGR